MLRKILLPLLLTLTALPHGARAQSTSFETSVEGSGYEDMAVGESRDVPCEYSYAPSFYSYYGVEFEDQMFMSTWVSERSDFPLPAWNWYYAYPHQTVVSNNGKYRWENAKIQVHCWVYRALYVLAIHRDHVASLGRLVEICGDDNWEEIEIEMQADDDGVTAQNSTVSAICGDAGGGGPGTDPGGSTWRCYTVTIDHYWYYPDTGRIEYRYTEEYSYCEQLS